MVTGLHVIVAVRNYLYEIISEDIDPNTSELLIGLGSEQSYQKETTVWGKQISLGKKTDGQLIYENQLLWLLKHQRLSSQEDDIYVKVHALDHFIRRDIAVKLAQEQAMDDAEAKVYNLPFTMRM
jgi:hypothetical protein